VEVQKGLKGGRVACVIRKLPVSLLGVGLLVDVREEKVRVSTRVRVGEGLEVGPLVDDLERDGPRVLVMTRVEDRPMVGDGPRVLVMTRGVEDRPIVGDLEGDVLPPRVLVVIGVEHVEEEEEERRLAIDVEA